MQPQRTQCVVPLEPNVRRRHEHTRVGRRVTGFSVQIEMFWKARWVPIVRYDTAHGFAHQDYYHPDGRVDKMPLFHQTLNEALDYAENDLRRNWARYVEDYVKEARK